MSEKPQGEGFSLPEDLIKGLNKFAKENEDDLHAREVQKIKDLILENNLSTESVAVADDVSEFVKSDKSEREDVSKRVGGSSFTQKANELIKEAEEADRKKPIYERQKNTVKNKKFNENTKIKRSVQRNREERNLLHRDKLRGVSVSSLPDANEIENTNFPVNVEFVEEKKYKDISKNPPEVEFYENEYVPDEEIVSELPDIKNLEGKELEFESGKKLKSAKERAMQSTNEVAVEYNDKKLKKVDIDSAISISDLIEKIENSEGLQGSQEYFDKETLKMIIEKVQSGELTIDYVTRSGGLRQKVFDLLNQETQEIQEVQPKQEIKKERVIEVVPPEVPTPPTRSEKPRISIDDSDIFRDVAPEMFSKLEASRDNLESVHGKLESVKTKYASPFKKFFLKAFNVGGKEIKSAVEESQKSEVEYLKNFDGVVEAMAEKEVERLESLHANNREKKEYQVIRFSDIPKDVLRNYPDVEVYFSEHDPASEGVALTTILKKETNLPFEFKKSLRDVFPDIVFEKVKSKFSRLLAQQQDIKN